MATRPRALGIIGENRSGCHCGRSALDTQTRIGVGFAAAFVLIGWLGPMITWWVAGPLMVGCAGVAIWGFWPLVSLVASVGLPFGYVPLEQAAGKLFGQMQGTAAAELARRSSDSPAEILNWFAYWMAQQASEYSGRIRHLLDYRKSPRLRSGAVSTPEMGPVGCSGPAGKVAPCS